LDGTGVTGAGLHHLRELHELRVLNLNGCRPVTDADLENLAGLDQLEELTLDSAEIGDDGLRRLQGMSHLAHLTLTTSSASPNGVARLRAELPDAEVDYFWTFTLNQRDADAVLVCGGLTVVLSDARLEFNPANRLAYGITTGAHQG